MMAGRKARKLVNFEHFHLDGTSTPPHGWPWRKKKIQTEAPPISHFVHSWSLTQNGGHCDTDGAD
jgi:hypothetical protein